MELVNLKKEENIENQNQNNSNLYGALISFQEDLSKVYDKLKKDTVAINSRYSYEYITLDTIISTIKPLLAKNGLMLSQNYEKDSDGEYIILTEIIHKNGASKVYKTPLINLQGGHMNNIQSLGASITYIRRYAVSSILGIATNDDTDANNEDTRITKKTNSTIENKKQEIKREGSKVAKYTHFEYLLKFSKKVHKRSEIERKPFSCVEQIEYFENSLKEDNDTDIKKYFELNPSFKDINTWKILISEYISATCSDMSAKVRSINKFYEHNADCFKISPIRLFSCLSQSKEFDYLF